MPLYNSFLRTSTGLSQAAMLGLLASLLAGLPADSAHAREFRINQDCVAIGCVPGDVPGFPILITEPGHYRLAGDLLPASDDATAIYIEVPGGSVVLDLGGYAIRGPHTCSGGTPASSGGAPITGCSFGSGLNAGAIRVQAAAELTIRNGTIRGVGSQGINLTASGLALIEDLLITENSSGISINRASPSSASLVRIRRVTVSRNLGTTIRRPSSDTGIVAIENSQVFGNGFRGVSMEGSGTSIMREVHFGRNTEVAMFTTGANTRCYSVSYFANNDGASQVVSCPGLFNRCVQGSC